MLPCLKARQRGNLTQSLSVANLPFQLRKLFEKMTSGENHLDGGKQDVLKANRACKDRSLTSPRPFKLSQSLSLSKSFVEAIFVFIHHQNTDIETLTARLLLQSQSHLDTVDHGSCYRERTVSNTRCIFFMVSAPPTLRQSKQ
jgi:hypothetical protein